MLLTVTAEVAGSSPVVPAIRFGTVQNSCDAAREPGPHWSRSGRILRSICALFIGLPLLSMVLGVIR